MWPPWRATDGGYRQNRQIRVQGRDIQPYLDLTPPDKGGRGREEPGNRPRRWGYNSRLGSIFGCSLRLEGGRSPRSRRSGAWRGGESHKTRSFPPLRGVCDPGFAAWVPHRRPFRPNFFALTVRCWPAGGLGPRGAGRSLGTMNCRAASPGPSVVRILPSAPLSHPDFPAVRY